MILNIILIFILLALSALFSCSETALFSLSRSEVAHFKSQRSIFSKKVIDALSQPRRLLVSILIGNELVNVAIAILVAALVYDLLEFSSWQMEVLVAVAISTPLVVVFGEVIPKNIGVRFASFLAPACAFIIHYFAILLSPVRLVLLKLADSVIHLFHGDPMQVRSMIMEEEFRQMVEMGLDEGSLEEAEGELIHRVFELGDRTVEDIMTPHEAIFSIGLDEDFSAVLQKIRTAQFSRIPVYDANPDDIVGILHVRDMFSHMRKRQVSKVRDMEQVIRPSLFSERTTTLENILKEFQKLKTHMAVVVDDRKRPIGVVTMDDIFNALFKD